MNTQETQINPFEDGSAKRALRSLPSFEEALARLLHTTEHGRPFGIARGPAGTGKSFLLEQVAEEFRHAGNECGLIDLRRTATEEFPWRVACELGATPGSTTQASCWRIIEDTVLGRATASRPTLLLLDHVDAADESLIQQVQRLIAVAEASAGWCTILCAGRTESPLVDALTCEQAELRIELAPLDRQEACDFLRQVVALTGCTPFTDGARRAVAEQTRGVVRDIMRLSRLALLAQVAEDATEVTDEMVTLVAGEVAKPHLRPLLDSRSSLRALAEERVTSNQLIR